MYKIIYIVILKIFCLQKKIIMDLCEIVRHALYHTYYSLLGQDNGDSCIELKKNKK